MNRLVLAGAAILALGMTGRALAFDDMPVAPRFTWTGCYLGGHVGGAWSHNDVTDPVLLAQDNIGGAGTTTGTTTVKTTPSGYLFGGQIGCDYQFTSSFVIGIEGAASGMTTKANTTVPLPANPGDTALVSVKNDFLPSVTTRFGYAFDRVMLYARGGVAWAGDKYDVTGTFTGTPFKFEGVDTRTGWTAGGGVDWAFSGHWSANLEYDFYQFGHRSVWMNDSINTLSGYVDAKQNVQVVKFSLNFHMWSTDR